MMIDFDGRQVIVNRVRSFYSFFVCLTLFHTCTQVWGEISSEQAAQSFMNTAQDIQKQYVKEVPMSKLLEGGLRGMLESLDDYSTYLNEEEFKQVQSQLSGEFGGVGIEFFLRRGRLIINQVLQGSPAENEGLEPGDIILKVNNRNLVNMTSSEVMGLIRGKKGTKVTLTIRRGSSDVFDVEILRESIKIQPIETKIQHNVGVITLPSFISQNTANDLRKAIQKILTKSHKLEALLIDLRDNTGGLVDQAVDASSLFISKGIVTYTQGRDQTKKDVYKANHSLTMNIQIPIVLLVNGETASSAEIFAGALRDHNHAVIVGEKTRGKGSVQLVMPKDNGRTALKLTVAYYFTPHGHKIDHEGIRPDIIIAQPKVTFSGDSAHGKSRTLHSDTDQQVTDTSEQEPGQELAQDPQLYQAIFIAKGLQFSTKKSLAS